MNFDSGDWSSDVGERDRSESAGVEGYDERRVTVAVSAEVCRMCDIVFARVREPAVEGRELGSG